MPWYYMWVKHGGGHQSTTDKFFYRDKPVPIDKAEHIRDLADEEFGYRDWGENSAIFRIKRVPKLPAIVKQRMLDGYARRIAAAKEMTKVLGRTKTYKPRCPKQAPAYPETSFMNQCIKFEGHKGKCDGRTWKIDRVKVGG